MPGLKVAPADVSADDFRRDSAQETLARLALKGKRPQDVAEQLDALSQAANGKLLDALSAEVHQLLAPLQALEAAPAEAAAPSAAADAARAGLQACVAVARLLLATHRAAVPPKLTALALELHDGALLSVPHSPTVQEAVARLCADYYLMDAPDADEVSPQLGPYLLHKAVRGTAADIKRLHAVRHCFYNFDLGAPESLQTSRSIQRLAASPVVLKSAEGRRLVAFMFDHCPELTHDLVATIRNQIAGGQAYVLDAYGEVLVKAWGLCGAEQRAVLEAAGIQDLMRRCVLVAAPPMHANLLRVLRAFHAERGSNGIAEMLCRLYEPILWPHLNYANARVRANALAVMFDAFPIQDPAAGKEATELRLNMQLTHVLKALKDTSPTVRHVAVAGACAVLGRFWEVIPVQVVAKLATSLQLCAADATSPAVRAAVATSVADLTDNANVRPRLSSATLHRTLDIMLPHLSPLLTDPVPRVRAAFARLLERVSLLATLQWWKIVPAAELLDVMASDRVVAPTVQRLLFSQLVRPAPALDLEACAGLLQLMRDNPAAGVAFCGQLAGQLEDGGREMALPGVLAVAAVLRQHLSDVEVSRAARKQAAVAEGEPEGDAEGAAEDAGAKRKKGRRAKRTAAAVADAPQAAQETPDDWAAIAAGYAELCARLCGMAEAEAAARAQRATDRAARRAAARAAETGGAARRGGRRKAKAAAEEDTSDDGGEDEEAALSCADVVPAGSLVALFGKAPSVQAARTVLALAQAAGSCPAAQELRAHCAAFVHAGAVHLPGVRQGAQQGLRVFLTALPRAGQVNGNQGAYVDLCCDVVDFLAAAEPAAGELLATLAQGLSGTAADAAADGGGARKRKGKATRKGGKRARAVDAEAAADAEPAAQEPCGGAGGALAMVAMLLRPSGLAADGLRGSEGLTALATALSGVCAARFADAAAATTQDLIQQEALQDALLAERCALLASALAGSMQSSSRVQSSTSFHSATCLGIHEALPPAAAPPDATACVAAVNAATAVDADDQDEAPAKRARTATATGWAAASVEAAALAAALDALRDMAVVANILFDALEAPAEDASEVPAGAPGTSSGRARDADAAAASAVDSVAEVLLDAANRFLSVCASGAAAGGALQAVATVAVSAMASAAQALCRGLSLGFGSEAMAGLYAPLGAALLASQAVATAAQCVRALQPHIVGLARSALQATCVFVHGRDAGALLATPATGSTMFSDGAPPEGLSELLSATIAYVGAEAAGGEGAELPAPALWLPASTSTLDASAKEIVLGALHRQLAVEDVPDGDGGAAAAAATPARRRCSAAAPPPGTSAMEYRLGCQLLLASVS